MASEGPELQIRKSPSRLGSTFLNVPSGKAIYPFLSLCPQLLHKEDSLIDF